jgi:hypothetical protein
MGPFDGSHHEITAAGWSYRADDQGRTIYRDPVTARWYAHSEAAAMMAARTYISADSGEATAAPTRQRVAVFPVVDAAA